jgi:hypothetical protein
MSCSTKIKSITELPTYVANLTPSPTFKQTDRRTEYQTFTLVNGRKTELMTVIGVVSYVKLTSHEATVTIDIVSKFMTSDQASPWVSTLTDVSKQSPLGTSESFFEPCRGNKMRFTHKPKDKGLVDTLELLNLKGKPVEGDAFNRGDLVVIDFALQVYSADIDSKQIKGARLILQCLQQLQTAYDDSYEPKLELPETPTKRRKV